LVQPGFFFTKLEQLPEHSRGALAPRLELESTSLSQ